MPKPTDTSERGLERLICKALTGETCEPPTQSTVGEPPERHGGVGWSAGNHHDYDREFCVDVVQLSAFLRATQPEIATALKIDEDSPTRRQFLQRLHNEINKHGIIYVLRNGIKHTEHNIEIFYGIPSKNNEDAIRDFSKNRFAVTRQLHYSNQSSVSLDMAMFINGLPILTLELKNNFTRQDVHDAIRQYKKDRDPHEKLFAFGRCIAHFAVDDNEIYFCTHLQGGKSWFLPFNRGHKDGSAGNPPNPNGLKVDYLWREVLARESLSDIIENYAQVIEENSQRTRNGKKVQIWPRYHQLDVVRQLLDAANKNGVGKCYLIQHSAGSGKSNSIAWLAHQLVGLEQTDQKIFDSVIVITDRVLLDRQIRDTINKYAQVSATVGGADDSEDLRNFIDGGKKIIISTIQKFPYILDKISDKTDSRNFAIIIDEAHSSQGGKGTHVMGQVLGADGHTDDYETLEDQINQLIEKRRLLTNASYFAFTATPKHKTLEIFGNRDPQPDSEVKFLPFHCYTMKQAIQEKFIHDVLANYTPIKSYYRLTKIVEGDPEFDSKRAHKKLRRFVEGHEHAIRLKSEIMVDHFHRHVFTTRKIGGQARAMVVTDGIKNAIKFYRAISKYLIERELTYKAIVAFSGEHEFAGTSMTEASLNGFPSTQIANKIREDPYRFLICADKFQTGYDEPLMHTMYVDKILSGIKAVQALSRLNRAHPQKNEVFVLDFKNNTGTIKESFSEYYRTTILADETDPNKLHDLQAEMDNYQVYRIEQINEVVELYLGGVERDKLDPILDNCVVNYTTQLNEDGQVDFKSKAKAFLRTYGFLSAILTFSNQEWEKLYIFLNFLVAKLPAPVDGDLSKGILTTINMDSYRVEVGRVRPILPSDENAEIEQRTETGYGVREKEMTSLTEILRQFHENFGSISWGDSDRIFKRITEEIPRRVNADIAYQNAILNSDKENARVEHDKVLLRVIGGLLKDDNELVRQFMDNDNFRNWMCDSVFQLTYTHRGN